MGYTTEFTGKFNLNKRLDPDTHCFLRKLNETRRMARKEALLPDCGVEGEFFVNGGGMRGQDEDASIIDYNRPPSTQPSLWCGWRPSDDGLHIEWDGAEKFYGYVEWIKYIQEKILLPKGYTLSGQVYWQGESEPDKGVIDPDQISLESIPAEPEAPAARKVAWD